MPYYTVVLLYHCDHFNACTLLWLKTKIHMLYYTYLHTYLLTHLLTFIYLTYYVVTYLLTYLCTYLHIYYLHLLTYLLHGAESFLRS